MSLVRCDSRVRSGRSKSNWQLIAVSELGVARWIWRGVKDDFPQLAHPFRLTVGGLLNGKSASPNLDFLVNPFYFPDRADWLALALCGLQSRFPRLTVTVLPDASDM
jgi:hypothetical protein